MWVVCRNNHFTGLRAQYELKLTVGKRYLVHRRYFLDDGRMMYDIIRDDNKLGTYAAKRFKRRTNRRLLLCL